MLRWGFSRAADLAEREFYDKYVEAYEDVLASTSADYAPGFMVPADYKWITRTVVAEVIPSAIRGV